MCRRLGRSEFGWQLLDMLTRRTQEAARAVIVCPASERLLDGHAQVLAREGVMVWCEPFDPGSLLEKVLAALRARHSRYAKIET
jgi:hypothetical protein